MSISNTLFLISLQISNFISAALALVSFAQLEEAMQGECDLFDLIH